MRPIDRDAAGFGGSGRLLRAWSDARSGRGAGVASDAAPAPASRASGAHQRGFVLFPSEGFPGAATDARVRPTAEVTRSRIRLRNASQVALVGRGRRTGPVSRS